MLKEIDQGRINNNTLIEFTGSFGKMIMYTLAMNKSKRYIHKTSYLLACEPTIVLPRAAVIAPLIPRSAVRVNIGQAALMVRVICIESLVAVAHRVRIRILHCPKVRNAISSTYQKWRRLTSGAYLEHIGKKAVHPLSRSSGYKYILTTLADLLSWSAVVVKSDGVAVLRRRVGRWSGRRGLLVLNDVCDAPRPNVVGRANVPRRCGTRLRIDA